MFSIIPVREHSAGGPQLAARWATAFNVYFLCQSVLQLCSHREFCKRPLINGFSQATLRVSALLAMSILETKAILVTSLKTSFDSFNTGTWDGSRISTRRLLHGFLKLIQSFLGTSWNALWFHHPFSPSVEFWQRSTKRYLWAPKENGLIQALLPLEHGFCDCSKVLLAKHDCKLSIQP